MSSVKDVSRLTSVSEQPRCNIMAACRDHISSVLEAHKGAAPQESVADKILVCCETLKQSVTAILDFHNQLTEDKTCKGRGDEYS